MAVALPVSVGWLALHGWRQGRTLRRWAERRGYRLDGRGGGEVDADVAAFRRDSRHLRRDLDKIRDVVEGRGVRFFRCLETLDLSPWRGGGGPPKTRVAVLFDASGRDDTYTVVDTDGRTSRSIAPGLRFTDSAAARRIESRLPGAPPHPVSVTLRPGNGLGLAYLLSPSGSVSEADLDYLERLAARLSRGGRGRRGDAPEGAGGGTGSRHPREDREGGPPARDEGSGPADGAGRKAPVRAEDAGRARRVG